MGATVTRAALEQAVDVLREVPWDAWELALHEEPEWLFAQVFLDRYGFGRLATLMVALGLDDYQLKGPAETAYWPRIREVLDPSPVPRSPEELAETLGVFFAGERLRRDKLKRLDRFLGSSLAGKLWSSCPAKIAGSFLGVWEETANVMRQKKEMKTIVFAMKCLAVALKGVLILSNNPAVHRLDLQMPVT
jgi:DNA-(apurinic or apyrimidinic site) lyase